MTPDPFCVLGAASGIEEPNAAFARLFGANGTLLERLHPDERAATERTLVRTAANGSAELLTRVRQSDGQYQSWAWSLVHDPQSDRILALGRRPTQNPPVSEAGTLLETLLEALPDAVNFKDAQGRWLLANKAMLRAFRLEGIDYRGKKDSELTPASPFFAEAFDYCERTDEDCWRSGNVTLAEENIPQPDGPPLIFESYKVPLFNPDGSRKGLVVIGHDVTERRRLEEERAQLLVREQRAVAEAQFARTLNELKNTFVNSVSHELRTPLTSIQGYAEFLLDELAGPLNTEQRDYVLHLERGAKRLGRLIDDLLDFARLEAGTFALRRQPTALAPIARDVLESLLPQAKEARVTLASAIGDDLPELDIDAQRVEQVLANLLSNAIKFSPADKTVTLRLARRDGRIRCEVEDRGVGIAPEDVPKLFQRFSQLREGAQKGRGTGLGLSIAKSIVEAHGGAIGLESTLGQGSRFWFELPITNAEG
ncbi:MAG TPA: PAS domain-containing sensor histidine kinase [Oscillatoriaceae cyanobacterium]